MTRRYVHNVGVDVPLLSYAGAGLTLPSYLHVDHQGSIVAVSDPWGAGTLNRYDEYGIPAATNTGRFQYTGQIWLPELGMYHYKARIYSPYLGRFLQTDPVGYQDQFNLYAYVGNDPVNFMDPTGELKRKANGDLNYSNIPRNERQPRSEVRDHPDGSSRFGIGRLFTDRGRAIEALDNEGEPRFDANCHGFTFADGRFWINDDQVQSILDGDGYRQVSEPRIGDVAIYRQQRRDAPAENDDIVHSGKVVGVNGNATTVESKNGPREVRTHSGEGGYNRPGRPIRVEYYRQQRPTRDPEAGSRIRRGRE